MLLNMSDHHYPKTTTSVKMQWCELIARCSGGRGSGSSRLWWRWWQCICHFGVKAGVQDRKVLRMSLGLFCDFLRVSDSFWMNERWLPVWWNGVVENNYIRTTKTPSVERRWLVKIPIFYKITTSPPFQNFSNRKSPQVGATLVKTHFQAMGGILRGTRRLCFMVGVPQSCEILNTFLGVKFILQVLLGIMSNVYVIDILKLCFLVTTFHVWVWRRFAFYFDDLFNRW